MKLLDFAKKHMLVLDGAMGTMRQAGLATKEIHSAYLKAGSNVILTDTFERNSDADIAAAVQTAKEAREGYNAFVALDIAPSGQLLAPLGTLHFEDAYKEFQRQVLAGVRAGVDAIYIETMTDLQEARCAVLAAKEACELPIFCTMSFEANQRTFTGTAISSMAFTLTGLGVDFIGLNCSVGPAEMKSMAEELLKWTHLPVIIKPNAGLPSFENGKTLFNVTPDEFAKAMEGIIALGVSGVGGCCGTTPDFIEKLAGLARSIAPSRLAPTVPLAVCSASQTVPIDRVRIVGERLNPTGKKKFQTALLNNDMNYITAQAVTQITAGAEILDVNVGMPKIDEPQMMTNVITHLQSVVSVPLQIDSANSKAIAAGLRAYCGKAIVNSVTGEDAALHEVLPIVRKYGAAIIGLTLDEKGIPKTAKERLQVAEKIVNTAISYGIPKQDIFIDCLTLTSGAEQAIAYETIDAIGMVHKTLGVQTVSGVSNVSFGLPAREALNQTFLALALANGLTLPIINPNDRGMVDTIYCFHQLKNVDVGSSAYIERFATATMTTTAAAQPIHDITYCIQNGLKEEARLAVSHLLSTQEPLDVVNQVLIPILDEIGKRYEQGELFLPQLLSAAEAAKAAFDLVNTHLPKLQDGDKHSIILATVKNDVHDIGKNIVKVVLENYGFHVIDLGKDVPIHIVAEQVQAHSVKLVGLSALMTTTLESMEQTITAVKRVDPTIIVMVGGAVVTENIAKKIGANFYAKDAISGVHIARTVFGTEGN